jgi:hypothetical protein
VRADADGGVVVATTVMPGADPSGIAVFVDAGSFTGSATLGPDGRTTVELGDVNGVRVTDSGAWAHDWSGTSVTVGVPVDETPAIRDRVRSFARSRLTEPGPDAFLAEIFAAEADY